jgi:hypothetical protein
LGLAKDMIFEKDRLNSFFSAVIGLRSHDPAVRRPAVSTLLDLACHAQGPAQLSAAQALVEEFGPYAVTHGLSGCSAPIDVVESCDGHCRTCVWLWQDKPVHEDPAQPALPANQQGRKAVA